MTALLSGDGANDVSMIQAADIGIGISGQEGMQVLFPLTVLVSSLLSLVTVGELGHSSQNALTLQPASITSFLLPSPSEHKGDQRMLGFLQTAGDTYVLKPNSA